MTHEELAKKIVDEAIVIRLLPQLYSIIDRLLDGNPDKKLIVDARRILPSNYKHSFERAKEKT
jgi:hypothetical protein